MPPGSVVMIARGAVRQDATVLLSPVRAMLQHAVHQPLRLPLPGFISRQRRQFLKPAGRDRPGNIIQAENILRLAEIAVRQSVFPNVLCKIRCDPFRCLQIFCILQMVVCQRESS